MSSVKEGRSLTEMWRQLMENKQLTLGSLFDGSGGFPLGGILAGIEPVWASEIEPFPIRVTTKRLPGVKHYGDVSQMDGGRIEPVDIITFGSPCQDMSIAGKREGLEGSRSSLFYEAVRIIKEMREATDGRYPKYIVWENVTGAFSSNRGEDFRCVLESICRIKDPSASVPYSAKWERAGRIMGSDYSVAWRVLDAQYWGVPQRRKRIYLVGDLDGSCAGKILFESEGLSGYSHEGFKAWQRAAGSPEGRPGKAGSICLNDQGGGRMDVTGDIVPALRAEAHHPPLTLQSAGFCTEHSANAGGIGYEAEKSPTLRAGVVPAALMFENHSQDARFNGPLDTAKTLTARYGTGGNNQPLVVETPRTFDVRFTSEGTRNARQNCYETDTSRTIDTGGNAPDSNQGGVAVVTRSEASRIYHSSKSSFHTNFSDEDAADTLVATDYKDPQTVSGGPEYTVRRLTPTECARLQGFPDWWCTGLRTDDPSEEEMQFWRKVFETHRRIVTGAKKPKSDRQIRKWLKGPHSDSAEYRMWGNGVALPCVCFVLSGIVYFDRLNAR
jgi:DNA (cytosine-5)-methyltransferase 1